LQRDHFDLAFPESDGLLEPRCHAKSLDLLRPSRQRHIKDGLCEDMDKLVAVSVLQVVHD
jgi:hypothetical protein